MTTSTCEASERLLQGLDPSRREGRWQGMGRSPDEMARARGAGGGEFGLVFVCPGRAGFGLPSGWAIGGQPGRRAPRWVEGRAARV